MIKDFTNVDLPTCVECLIALCQHKMKVSKTHPRRTDDGNNDRGRLVSNDRSIHQRDMESLVCCLCTPPPPSGSVLRRRTDESLANHKEISQAKREGDNKKSENLWVPLLAVVQPSFLLILSFLFRKLGSSLRRKVVCSFFTRFEEEK